MKTLEQRFWKYVDRRSPDDCWNWTGTKIHTGYGQLRTDKGREQAHRISYRLAYGPFNESLSICHKCDNPSCVNPAHLFAGTHQDNMIDMVRKGRHRKAGGRKPIVSEEKIATFYQHGFKQAEIARYFKVSQATISYHLKKLGINSQPYA